MEIMVPSLEYLHLILYPAIATLAFTLFADKTERKLELERNTKKRGKDINPLVRTPLATFLMCLVFQLVCLFYVLLQGVAFSWILASRLITDLVYTTTLSVVLMVPLRAFLGLKSFSKHQIEPNEL